jgi:outer membrane protein TolC
MSTLLCTIRQSRTPAKPLLVALLAVSLVSCASVPPPKPGVAPQASAQALEQRSLRDPGLQRFIALQTGAPQPADQPWTLQRLSLAALYFHPALRVDRAGVQLAEADLQIARQYPNPSLNLGLKYGSAAALAAPSPWTVGAAIGLLLVSHAQRQAQAAQAEAGVRAARLLLHGAIWQARARVQRAYVALWAAQQQARLQQQVLDTDLDLQGRTATRARAGLDSPLAAALAQQAAQTAALQGSHDQGKERAAHAALAAAIGVPDAALRAIRIDFSALDATPPQPAAAQLAQLRSEALAQRDDVRAAWQQEQAAQAALRLAQAQRDGGPPSIAPGAERDQGVNRLMFNARVPLPLFNQHQGQIAAAHARLARAHAVLQQVQAQVLAGIEQASIALQAAQAQARQADALRSVNRSLLQADATAQRQGLIGPVQVLRSRLRLLRTEQAALRASAAQWQALGALQTALQHALKEGGPPPHPVPSPAPEPTPSQGQPYLSAVVWHLQDFQPRMQKLHAYSAHVLPATAPPPLRTEMDSTSPETRAQTRLTPSCKPL